MKFKWKKIVSALLIVVFTVLSVSDYTGGSNVIAAESNSVTVHFKCEGDGANIFYWNQNAGYNNPVKWPGAVMTAEGDGWYSHTFENTKKVTFMFQYGKKQTSHFTKENGEYWYVSDTWYNHKPIESEITPTPTAKPTATPKPTATAKPTTTPKPTEALMPTRAVTPTAAPQVTVAPSDKSIRLHYRGEQQNVSLFYWNVNYGTNTPVAWPGTKMISKGSNWFEYTIPNAESANVIFVTEAGETEELFVLDGEWWYIDGEIMDYNPYGDEPVITTVPVTGAPKPTVTLAPAVTDTPVVTATPSITVAPILPTEPAATVAPTATLEPTATPKPAVKGKIIVHFYSTSASMNIHYWDAVGAATKETNWPGVSMTSEGNNWYTYTIEGATSASMLFNCNSNKETADLEGVKEGEHWYKDNKWYDYNPSGPTPTPGPTSTPTPTSTPRPTNSPTPTRNPNLPTPTPGGGAERGEDWDFRDETIYFLITTRFYDGDSSNNYYGVGDAKAQNPESDPSWRGDFKGLIEKLDYIKALGFTAIWITPVVENKSDYDYHGYHAYNFSKIDSRYESEGATYQDLIDACHAKGIKVIQDVVLNHCSQYGEVNLLTTTGSTIGERNQIIMNGTGDYSGDDAIFHHNGYTDSGGYDQYICQTSTMADDCFDLETENPKVYNYLIDCYKDIIATGVDGFRVDTVKHMSRLLLNSTFLLAFREAGGEDFFMFGEVCTKGHDVWYRSHPGLSTCFYTWAEESEWANVWTTSTSQNETLVENHFTAHDDTNNQPTSSNAFLDGNNYHTPDYSKSSGLATIDFQMHWSFDTATNAFSTARQEDAYFNDSTWNVMYVDSHDYAPDTCQTIRYNGGEQAWAENLCLMFTFRGIPCLYYGSEIQFQAGQPIDKGTSAKLADTGRAYYGDHLEGEVTATDFGEYTASGEVATTLSQPLAKHLQRLNKIRAAIPALRKGQYSTDGVNGNMAYKRRYTNTEAGIDSFVCVTVTDGATFTGLPGGTYTDAVTGDVQTVSEGGSLSISAPGQGNMRVYVLDTGLSSIDGPIGVEVGGTYLK